MKKGFTLIELLAVIVILAIIALIAVPLVLNVIENSKTRTKEISVKNYIKAVENRLVMEEIEKKTTIAEGTYDIMTNGNICLFGYDKENDYCNESYTLIIKISGNKPISGKIKIKSKKVLEAKLKYSEFSVIMNANKVIEIDPPACKIVDGNINNVGSKVKCENEYFYILKVDSKNDTIYMLSENNISLTPPIKQSSNAETIKYADYYQKTYFESYNMYLQEIGLNPIKVEFPSADLIINFSNVETDGAYVFPDEYDWLYNLEYWVGDFEYGMDSKKLTPHSYYNPGYDSAPSFGIRPLVVIKKSEIR